MPGGGFSTRPHHGRRAKSAAGQVGRLGSVGFDLLIGFAIALPIARVIAPRVLGNARSGVLIAMGAVLDQFLLGLLETLRLAATGLLDRATLLQAALLQVVFIHVGSFWLRPAADGGRRPSAYRCSSTPPAQPSSRRARTRPSPAIPSAGDRRASSCRCP